MHKLPTLTLLLFTLAGCHPTMPRERSASPDMFAAADMRIHPIFTQIKDWTSDGQADGIEALLEFNDRFDDPTKAAGQVLFELFDYRPANPDPRGPRLVNPWIGALATVADQKTHWNDTTQTYNFQLAYPQISAGKTYVLTATFETAQGRRYFNSIILTPSSVPAPKEPSVESPATQPAN